MTGFIVLVAVFAVFVTAVCVGTYVFEKAPIVDDLMDGADVVQCFTIAEVTAEERYHGSSQWGR